MTELNRRRFLQASAAAALTAGAASSVSAAPFANAQQRRVLGTVVDYSAGVPSARSVKAAGHIGAVRYVSERRPGADWMRGKPVTLRETQDFKANGLATASVYQFGRAETADWKRGAAGAAVHAPQAMRLHAAAGGPTGRPIYVAIDDNPTLQQFNSLISPYLRAFGVALETAGYKLGVYGNYWTIAWCLEDRIGSYFWQHDWGSQGKIHPRANIHQVARWQAHIDGVQVDINNVYAADWGQWTPGSGPTPAPTLTFDDVNRLIQGSSQMSSNALGGVQQGVQGAQQAVQGAQQAVQGAARNAQQAARDAAARFLP
ncbi:DUF1906 domain-containing protein [Corynebacterium sp. Marseille-P4321]|uniref:DUF1906 domain-containing protein n=1 Tax=Corynebacterium sp. Marseille-P4321 TaxID=2736603 RepID=UPI001C37C662|nr:DUF1906 domain-containing protein [Corynebacterium sp. Marseille-P4321]